MTTYISGRQDTNLILAAEREYDVEPELAWLEPNNAPLVKLLRGGNPATPGRPIRKEETTDSRFRVFEKVPHGVWTAVNYTTGYTAGATTLVLDDVTHINVGWNLKVVGGEILHVTAKSNGDNSVTVARGAGATTAATTIADNTPIYAIGNAQMENSDAPTELLVQNRSRDNFTQIFRRTIGASRTLMKTKLRTGNKMAEMKREDFLEFEKEMERAFIMGEPKEDLSTYPHPWRMTGGADYWIRNGGGSVTTATTTFTKQMWMTWTRTLFRYGSDTKIVLCAPLIIEMLDYWKDSKLNMRPSEMYYNIRVAEWESGQGLLILVKDRELQYSPAGDTTKGYGGSAYALDIKNIKYRYLTDSDMKYRENIIIGGKDGQTDEYLAEVGLEVQLPETHSILENVQSYAA